MPRVDLFVSIYSGFRRVKEDQLPRLKAKIEESFPKFAEDEKHVQKIIDIVNSCVYDERLVSLCNCELLLYKPVALSMRLERFTLCLQHVQREVQILNPCSDKGLTLETSAYQIHYGG